MIHYNTLYDTLVHNTKFQRHSSEIFGAPHYTLIHPSVIKLALVCRTLPY